MRGRKNNEFEYHCELQQKTTEVEKIISRSVSTSHPAMIYSHCLSRAVDAFDTVYLFLTTTIEV